MCQSQTIAEAVPQPTTFQTANRQALKDGGALHLYDAQGSVYVNRTVLDGNVAGERGGGAALDGVALAVVERCRVTNNRVYNGTVSMMSCCCC